MRWTNKQEGAQAIGQLGSQSDRQSEWADQQVRRQMSTKATTKHTSCISQADSQTHRCWCGKQSRLPCTPWDVGHTSVVVALRWGVSLQGSSDPLLRWSVNTHSAGQTSAASSELSGAALPRGFKGCFGNQISVMWPPDSLIFKYEFDFALELWNKTEKSTDQMKLVLKNENTLDTSRQQTFHVCTQL